MRFLLKKIPIALFLLLLLFQLGLQPTAHAQNEFDAPGQNFTGGAAEPPATPVAANCESWIDIPCMILKGINTLVDFIAWLPTYIANTLLFAAIDLNSSGTIANNAAVKIGWGIARDTANIFFIIVLIISAVATIFDLEALHAKNVLPRLIFVALLINFSLVIGQFIIRESNALGLLFLRRAQIAGGEAGLPGALRNMVNFDAVRLEALGASLEENGGKKTLKLTGDAAKDIPEILKNAPPISVPVSDIEREQFSEADLTKLPRGGELVRVGYPECGTKSGSLYGSLACARWSANAIAASTNALDPYLKLGLAILVKMLVYPIAVFVFLAGAAMLIARIIALTFILILAPLAFFSYMIPKQSKWYDEWWQKLFSHSLFFPAYAFFLMFSILFFNSLALDRSGGFSGQLISYFVGIGLMIGSLIAAKQLGAYGSAAMLNFGKKQGKNLASGVGNWAKSRALRGVKGVAEDVSEGLSKYRESPGFGRRLVGQLARPVGRLAETTARAGGAARKDFKKEFEDMDDRALARAYDAAVSADTRKTILEVASEKNKFGRFSETALRTIYQDAKSKPQDFEMAKRTRGIENSRPDLALKILQEKASGAPESEKKTYDQQQERITTAISKKILDENIDPEKLHAIIQNPVAISTIVKTWSMDKLQIAMEKSPDEFTDQYLKELERIAAKEDPREFTEIIRDPAMRTFIIRAPGIGEVAKTAYARAIRYRKDDDEGGKPRRSEPVTASGGSTEFSADELRRRSEPPTGRTPGGETIV